MHIDLKYNQIYPVLESTILTSHDLTSKKQSFYKVVFVPKNSSQFHVFQVGEACIEYIENPGANM